MDYLQFLPVGKLLWDGLNYVLNTNTDKSPMGSITRGEIVDVLVSCVDVVATKLGYRVIKDEKK